MILDLLFLGFLVWQLPSWGWAAYLGFGGAFWRAFFDGVRVHRTLTGNVDGYIPFGQRVGIVLKSVPVLSMVYVPISVLLWWLCHLMKGPGSDM